MSRDKRGNRTQEVVGSIPISSTKANELRNNNLGDPRPPSIHSTSIVVACHAAGDRFGMTKKEVSSRVRAASCAAQARRLDS
jgi:hypothetical protein